MEMNLAKLTLNLGVGLLVRIFCLFFVASVFADKAPVVLNEKYEELPWLTGPLIASSSLALKKGQFNAEPYIFANANTGTYNEDWKVHKTPTLWNINILAPLLYFGLNDFMDFTVTPSFQYNICEDQENFALGNFNFGFDFQLYEDDYYKHDWYPNIKLSLTENIPLGRYDRLNPKKRGTQIGGNGSYATLIELVFGKLVHISGVYHFASRLAIIYTIPAPVKVRGLSVFGGGEGTRVKVYPAQVLNVDFGFEINLSKNWAFAGDIIGDWATKTRFKGNPGFNSDGSQAKIGPGSSFQFSLAPALEYNWNANIGLVFGVWFTAMGRNSPQFTSGVVAFNYFK